MQLLKTGIAGYGVVGKRRHEFMKSHSMINVVAVCDQAIKDSFTSQNGVKHYSNYQDLLKEDLDILFVCLTNDVAAEVTIAGLENNLHVFCEKPPGRNVDDIKKVIECEKNNNHLKLKYGFNHRYHDSVKMALEIIKSGNLGTVVNIRGVYGKSKIIDFSGGWRSQRKISGGGILLDQGIHMVDLMRLFCDEFEEVKSFISNSYWSITKCSNVSLCLLQPTVNCNTIDISNWFRWWNY